MTELVEVVVEVLFDVGKVQTRLFLEELFLRQRDVLQQNALLVIGHQAGQLLVDPSIPDFFNYCPYNLSRLAFGR